MATVERDAPTYAQINRNAQPYPSYELACCDTGLALFCAGFHGWNDVIHMARRGLSVHCIDTDADRLAEMTTIYPESWMYLVRDAWEFAESAAEAGVQWDAVTADPFLGDACAKAMTTLELWCVLAARLVTLTVPAGFALTPPTGWDAYLYPRSTRADWLVLRRA